MKPLASPRLILLSNRGPYRLQPSTLNGKLRRERTVGGLVTSVLPLIEQRHGLWIAAGEPEGKYVFNSPRCRFTLRYLHLTAEQVQGHYQGVSNNALWPLCHYFLNRARYDEAEWQAYEAVNQRFAEAALAEAGEGDVIWVHDYQLARVPFYLRQARPSARVLFFWHIPFPAVEVFRTLPWRKAVLESLLACDVIGFHIPEYAENFMEAAHEILGATVGAERLDYAGRTSRILARPLGIDFQAIDRQVRTPRVEARARQLHEMIGECTLMLGVERMDYTKGILERLRGLEYLLEHSPKWRGKFCLIQIVTPSRGEVEAYHQKKREVDEAVGRINGQFSEGGWLPVRYSHRSFSPSELLAYYRAADIALVTPLRDGLNLVAKEFVAARIHDDGVLILSEFAGVAFQLPEALLTNPYSPTELAASLEAAFQMPKDEQRSRMTAMRERLKAQDIVWWSKEFLENGGIG
jgi:alpha,alpha-trehalose-phosphate synthase [UDP-forming]